jgi:hypothetical protein
VDDIASNAVHDARNRLSRDGEPRLANFSHWWTIPTNPLCSLWKITDEHTKPVRQSKAYETKCLALYSDMVENKSKRKMSVNSIGFSSAAVTQIHEGG